MSRRTLALVSGLVLLAGCSPDPTPLPPRPTTAGPSAGPTDRTERTAVVPEELAGAWSLVTERGNSFGFELYPDGKYVYVGIMQDGSQRYTLKEGGRVRVDGDEITFAPQLATLTRTDPDGPEPTSESHPVRPPRTMTWSVSGRVLTFVENGSPTSYRRD